MPEKDASTLTCVIAVNSGSSVEISYDTESEQIKYLANVKFGTYLSLGYGSSMKDTDYIVWQSIADDEVDPEEQTSQIDCYSVANHHPVTNAVNTYSTTISKSEFAELNTFVSYRPLEATGQNTYSIPLDSNIKMVYAFNPQCGMMCNHNRDYGYFDMKLDS